jgi:uncharacterized membrane protein YkvI
MLSVLLSGLRSLRVSLVTGGMLVGVLYIFTYEALFYDLSIRSSAINLIHMSSFMPPTLILFSCVIIGSLYTTLLEGIVDLLHRKYVHKDVSNNRGFWDQVVISALLPYSDSAKKRLISEVTRFYRENTHFGEFGGNGENEFIDKVLIEVLWMEDQVRRGNESFRRPPSSTN